MNGETPEVLAGTVVRVSGALRELAEMRLEVETEFPGETELLRNIVHLESRAHGLLRSLVMPTTSH